LVAIFAALPCGGLLAFLGSQLTMIIRPSSQQGQRRSAFGGSGWTGLSDGLNERGKLLDVPQLG